jgi:hypothetical protein
MPSKGSLIRSLRAALKEAGHRADCAATKSVRTPEGTRAVGDSACNCWRRRAELLVEERQAAGA